MPTWTTMTNLAAGDTVAEADMDALQGNIEYLLAPNYQQQKRTGGSYTTTSTSFVDVDGATSDLEVTITTNGGHVKVEVVGSVYNNTPGSRTYLDITVDGTRQGGSDGLITMRSASANAECNASFALSLFGLAAGSHTFKLQWRVDGNTGTFIASAACPAILTVYEF